MARLGQILDTLEAFHGRQTARWPTDPYQFLVWWHCGYPASEERCGRGWESLNQEIGVAPGKLLETPSSQLARVLQPGGMIPELRAGRLKQIAQRVQEELDGDLRAALTRLSLAEARAVLKKFPGIADPGADRILLFAGLGTPAAVPSSCPQVLVRIESGHPHETYNANYRESQQILRDRVPETIAAQTRAYLLIQQHGSQVCKRSSPQCGICPVATSCKFFAGKPRSQLRRSASRS